MKMPWSRRPHAEPAHAPTAAVAPPAGLPAATPAAPAEPAPSPAGWAFLPPLQRTIGAAPSTTRPAAFPSTLRAWQNPSFMGRMAHAVTDSAPSGVIDGDGHGVGETGQPGTRSPVLDLALSTPPPSPAMPVQRATAAPAPAAPARTTSTLTSAPVTAAPVMSVTSHPFDAAVPTIAQPELRPAASAPLLPETIESPTVTTDSLPAEAATEVAEPASQTQAADLPLVQRAVADSVADAPAGPAAQVFTPDTAPVLDNGGETVVDLPGPDAPTLPTLPLTGPGDTSRATPAASPAALASIAPPAVPSTASAAANVPASSGGSPASTPAAPVSTPQAPLQPKLSLQRATADGASAAPTPTSSPTSAAVSPPHPAAPHIAHETPVPDGATPPTAAAAHEPDLPTAAGESSAPVSLEPPASPERPRLGLGAPLPPGAHSVQRSVDGTTTPTVQRATTAAASPSPAAPPQGPRNSPEHSPPSTPLPLADLVAAISAATDSPDTDHDAPRVTLDEPRTSESLALPVQRAVHTDPGSSAAHGETGHTHVDGDDAPGPSAAGAPIQFAGTLGSAPAAATAPAPAAPTRDGVPVSPAPAAGPAAPSLPVQRTVSNVGAAGSVGPAAPVGAVRTAGSAIYSTAPGATAGRDAGARATALDAPNPGAPALPMLTVQRTAALLGDRPIEAMFTPSLAPASAPAGATPAAAEAPAVRPTFLDPALDLPSPGSRAHETIRSATAVPDATGPAPAHPGHVAAPSPAAAPTPSRTVQRAVDTAPAPVAPPPAPAAPPLALQRFGLSDLAGAAQTRPSISQLGSSALGAAHNQVSERASGLTSQLPGGVGAGAQHLVEDPSMANLEGAGHEALGAAEGAAEDAAGGALTHARSAVGGAAAGAAAGALGTSPEQIDALAKKLVEPLSRRIKAEMLLDRERRGMRSDAR